LKIALDSRTLSRRFRYHGTYVYTQNLIAEFKKIANERPGIQFCLFTSSGDSNDAQLVEPGERFELSQTSLLRRDRLWRFGGVGRAAARVHAGVIFAPAASIVPLGNIPVVSTIHDVIPVIMATHSWKITLMSRSLLWVSAKFSSAIITDSECSKRDLVHIYGLPENKVSVVYLGYDKSVFNELAPDSGTQAALLKRLGIDRPYILHHGTIQPRKNLIRLMRAYDLLLQRCPSLDVQLVLVGSLGWQYEEIVKVANESRSRGKITLTGPLKDGELAILLKGTSLVVIPSLYEGFCLPMIEAMACGAPAVVSGTSCLPEVSGNTLLYFDPSSIEEIAGRMQSVLLDNELSSQLRRRGIERAGKFSWEHCAKQTVEVLIGAATEGNSRK
jgi:glycosyltransferase involved in cell wall biosynthesis